MGCPAQDSIGLHRAAPGHCPSPVSCVEIQEGHPEEDERRPFFSESATIVCIWQKLEGWEGEGVGLP